MLVFTNPKYADMLLISGKAEGNNRLVARMCAELYPQRKNKPDRGIFNRFYIRIRETEYFEFNKKKNQ